MKILLLAVLLVASANAVPIFERFSLPFNKDDILKIGFSIFGELESKLEQVDAATEEISPAKDFIEEIAQATEEISPAKEFEQVTEEIIPYEDPNAPEHIKVEEIEAVTEEFTPYVEHVQFGDLNAPVLMPIEFPEEIEAVTEEFTPYEDPNAPEHIKLEEIEAVTEEFTPYEDPNAPEHMPKELVEQLAAGNEEIVQVTEEISPAEEIEAVTEEFTPYVNHDVLRNRLRQWMKRAPEHFKVEEIEAVTEEFTPYVQHVQFGDLNAPVLMPIEFPEDIEAVTEEFTPYEDPNAPEHIKVEEIEAVTEEFTPYEDPNAPEHIKVEEIEAVTEEFTPYLQHVQFGDLNAPVLMPIEFPDEIEAVTEEFTPYEDPNAPEHLPVEEIEAATEEFTPYEKHEVLRERLRQWMNRV